jgi:hypothetical protein
VTGCQQQDVQQLRPRGVAPRLPPYDRGSRRPPFLRPDGCNRVDPDSTPATTEHRPAPTRTFACGIYGVPTVLQVRRPHAHLGHLWATGRWRKDKILS